jgi:very-short-patch-repair endonuclease
VERGYWATNRDADEADTEDPMSNRIRTVIPYVEDHRNVLTVKFNEQHDEIVMASLQSAFKQAIQQIYQLEPGELAADALPKRDDRQLLFFYESAEGGAGVLRNLLDPGAFARVARTALEICHYVPDTGEDLSKLAASGVQCEAACYDCLLEYGNQMDHNLIDRTSILPILTAATSCVTESSSTGAPRLDQLQEMLSQCDSELEKKWLRMVHESNMRLPTHCQHLIESCNTRADFLYKQQRTAIYIDGPMHDQPHVAAEDRRIETKLRAAGILFIRFHHAEDWSVKLRQFGDIFEGARPTVDRASRID